MFKNYLITLCYISKLLFTAARVDGHSSVELEAFYKNAMKNIKSSTFHSEIVEKSPFSPLQVLPEIKKLTHSIVSLFNVCHMTCKFIMKLYSSVKIQIALLKIYLC